MYQDFYSQAKMENNKIFMSSIVSERVLILDGPDLQTSGFLLNNNFNGIIHIVEKNKKTFNKQEKKNKSENVKIHCGDLLDFLKKDNNFTDAYFDFTCTPRGSVIYKIYPMSTIDYFLRGKEKDIQLAVTFSTRLKVKYTNMPMADEILEYYLNPCFTFNQYEIHKKTIKTYRRDSASQTMAFFMFHLKKNKKINPEKVGFIIEGKKTADIRFPGYNTKINLKRVLPLKK